MAYMSEEGYKQLIEEQKYLESVERPKIMSAIAEARDKGDLSENAEYEAAKEAQGLLEMKICQLKSTIGDAKIIDTSKMNADTVQILTKLELKNAKTGMKMVYTIVAERDVYKRQVDGLSFEILEKALLQAKEGREHILNKLTECIAEPRKDLKPHAPRIETMTTVSYTHLDVYKRQACNGVSSYPKSACTGNFLKGSRTCSLHRS